MRKIYIFLFAAFCLTALSFGAKADPLCSSITGNLVTNCGFETGDFTGWTLSGNDVPGELGNLYGVEGQDPVDGIFPHSGNDQAYFADLDANATTISQTIGLSGPYQEYTVSFYLAQDTAPVTPYSNELNVAFGGTTYISDSGIAVEGYTKYSFVASDSLPTALLSITLGNDGGEFLLDDVSVVSTPEPSAWFLLLTAGALCVFGARSRFRQKSVI
jgi:hypothetical protein